jgi:Rgp1
VGGEKKKRLTMSVNDDQLPVEAALVSDVLTPGSWLSGAVRVGVPPAPPLQNRSSSSTTSGTPPSRHSVAWIAVQTLGIVSADPSWLTLPSEQRHARTRLTHAAGADASGAPLSIPVDVPGGASGHSGPSRRTPQIFGAVVVPPGVVSSTPSSLRHSHSTPPSESDVGSGGYSPSTLSSGGPRELPVPRLDPQTISEVAQLGDVSRRMQREWEQKFGKDYDKQQQFVFATPCVLLGHDVEIGVPATGAPGDASGSAGTRDGESRIPEQGTPPETRSAASFEFAIRLPYTLPPSFSGCGLRYRYFVCVCVALKSAGTPPSFVFSVPFRVVNPTSAVRRTVYRPMLPDTHDFSIRGRRLDLIPGPREEVLRSAGLRRSESEASPLRRSRHRRHTSEYEEIQQEHDMIQSLTAVRQVMEKHAHTVTAAIRRASLPGAPNETDLVATVSMSRTSFTLGDVVEGVVHFPTVLGGRFAVNRDASEGGDTGSGVVVGARCYQLTIRLEVEETLDRRFASRRRGLQPHTRCVAEQHELVESTAFSTFSLHIPAEATPEMMTELVSVRWLLHFEFIVSPPGAIPDSQIRAAMEKSPDRSTAVPTSTKPDTRSVATHAGTLRDAPPTVLLPRRPSAGRPDTEPLHWSLPVRVLVADLPAQPIVPKRHRWTVVKQA